jgi:purine catabolism regulator
LLEYDRKRKGSLLITLEKFLATKSVIKKSAEELFIHVKTMEYRLKKIEEILGVDLSDSEVCLELNIAIKIYRLF